MRDILKRSLGASLSAMPELDRLAAAWPVACGSVLAGRGQVVAFAGGVLTVTVDDPAWLEQMHSMRPVLERELARIAAVPLRTIHFELRRSTR